MSLLKTIESLSKCCNVGYITQDNIMVKCPNCEKKIIRSYPTTTCTYCQTVFQNKIEPVRKHISYKAAFHLQPSGPVFYDSDTTICGMVSSMLRERTEMQKYKKLEDITSDEYAAALIYSTDDLYKSLGYKT